MITETIKTVEFLNFELGPITLSLITTMILALLMVLVKAVFVWFVSKGRKSGFINRARDPYSQNFTTIVFVSFLLLSLIVKLQDLPFDDPLMLVITSIIILVFVGWSMTSDIATLKILVIALAGSFLGHLIATIITQ